MGNSRISRLRPPRVLEAANNFRVASKGGVVAGAVPEMKNLDEVSSFIDPVEDQDGRMHELTDSGPTVHGAADEREAF